MQPPCADRSRTPEAVQRAAWNRLWRLLLAPPVDARDEQKETAPMNQIGAVGVEFPRAQTRGADDMRSIAYTHTSVKDEPSDRRLGAQAQPGLGDARPRGQEGLR